MNCYWPECTAHVKSERGFCKAHMKRLPRYLVHELHLRVPGGQEMFAAIREAEEVARSWERAKQAREAARAAWAKEQGVLFP